MRVVVEKKPYRGNAVGSQIEVSRQTARVLVAVGLAAIAPEAIVPEIEAVIEEPEKLPAKRAYKRRDMQAE